MGKIKWVLIIVGVIVAILILAAVVQMAKGKTIQSVDEKSDYIDALPNSEIEGKDEEKVDQETIDKYKKQSIQGDGIETIDNSISTSENDLDLNEYSLGREEHKVSCNTKTKEEAEAIAKQIGGVLIDYQYEIGTIEIQETVDELMLRIEKMPNRPKIYPCYITSLKDE